MNFFIPSFLGLCVPYLFYILMPITLQIDSILLSFFLKLSSFVCVVYGIFTVISSAKIIYGHLNTPLWDRPPEKLAFYGPYRYCRNPMTLGFSFILLGESLFFKSVGIFIWAIIFLLVSIYLIVKIEEPSLRNKFGKEYDEYLYKTPRWFKFNYIISRGETYEKDV
ncbi:methyltransferase family protein [Bacillus bombysepticus]|uniref:methyltransferase family protein n=1 Tax=Bacillus bombysepticus TaxID=658666 RepID=UPI00207AAE20|nr:methyltransferase [Bacillus bombysepticus]USL11094.1 hypothetical protein LIT24_29270 [Bacillus bombysepticus]